jgi:hypothetical protein
MKLALWDEWHDFFIPHGSTNNYQVGHSAPFIQFNSGELIVNNRGFDPNIRKRYPDLNVRIVATTDYDCPTLTRVGETKPIPKSHLNHRGQQILLVDEDQGIAVGLFKDKRGELDFRRETMPQRFLDRKVAAYYAGENREPIGHPIILEYAPPLTNEQKEHIHDLTMACETWMQMSTDPNHIKLWDKKSNNLHAVPISMPEAMKYTFASLDDKKREQIALQRLDRGTQIEVLDKVLVR